MKIVALGEIANFVPLIIFELQFAEITSIHLIFKFQDKTIPMFINLFVTLSFKDQKNHAIRNHTIHAK